MSETLNTFNTLVVYRISDNRIVHSRAIAFGLPNIEDISTPLFDSSSAIFDPLTMDYQVGVMNYDPEDFDDDGILTDDACEKYGVTQEEVDHYVKDQLISVPQLVRSVQDLVFDSSTGGITELLQAVETQPRYLKLEITGATNTRLIGTNPVTGLPMYTYHGTEHYAKLTLTLSKLDADGDPMTGPSDDNVVTILADGGLLCAQGFPDSGAPEVTLYNGQAEIEVRFPLESKIITIIAKANEPDDGGYPIIETSLSFIIGGLQLQ